MGCVISKSRTAVVGYPTRKTVFLFDLLPTEALVEIFQRLPVRDILTMRRVSTRLKMVAREKEIWKGIVIWKEGLYYDNDYKGDYHQEPKGGKLADLKTVTTEELEWLVFRARVAVLTERYKMTLWRFKYQVPEPPLFAYDTL